MDPGRLALLLLRVKGNMLLYALRAQVHGFSLNEKSPFSKALSTDTQLARNASIAITCIISNHKNMSSHYTIYIDGGSRGNPGSSAFACVFPELNKEYSEHMGKATNNEAEYGALIFALKKAKSLLGKDKIKQMTLEIKADSELLVKQMQGKYKIKEPHIQQLFLTAWNLKTEFKEIIFTHIPREQNTKADHLLNATLDREVKKQTLF